MTWRLCHAALARDRHGVELGQLFAGQVPSPAERAAVGAHRLAIGPRGSDGGADRRLLVPEPPLAVAHLLAGAILRRDLVAVLAALSLAPRAVQVLQVARRLELTPLRSVDVLRARLWVIARA